MGDGISLGQERCNISSEARVIQLKSRLPKGLYTDCRTELDGGKYFICFYDPLAEIKHSFNCESRQQITVSIPVILSLEEIMVSYYISDATDI